MIKTIKIEFYERFKKCKLKQWIIPFRNIRSFICNGLCKQIFITRVNSICMQTQSQLWDHIFRKRTRTIHRLNKSYCLSYGYNLKIFLSFQFISFSTCTTIIKECIGEAVVFCHKEKESSYSHTSLVIWSLQLWTHITKTSNAF